MTSIDYIADVADKLTRKFDTRNPYKICDALDVRIRLKDLGTDIKAYYFYHSRIRNIVLNTRVSEIIRRILVAHELGYPNNDEIPTYSKHDAFHVVGV